jgi:hypothetical protein
VDQGQISDPDFISGGRWTFVKVQHMICRSSHAKDFKIFLFYRQIGHFPFDVCR